MLETWTVTQVYYAAKTGAGNGFDPSRTCRLCGGKLQLPGVRWTEAGNTSNWTDENLLRAPWSEWLCEGCNYVRKNRSNVWSGGSALVVSPQHLLSGKVGDLPDLLASVVGWPRFVAVRGGGADIQKHSLFRALDALYYGDGDTCPVFFYDFGNWTFKKKGLYAGPMTGTVPVNMEVVKKDVPLVEEILNGEAARIQEGRTTNERMNRGTLMRYLLGFALRKCGFPGIEGFLAAAVAADRAAERHGR